MIERAAAGALVALFIALAARRARALSPSGAAAAVVVGTVSAAAGWNWALLLILFFLSSSLLTRLGVEIKEARTQGIVAKGGPRDAPQVAANGGIYALCAAFSIAMPWEGWTAAAAGSLAAAAADTWSTEIGTLLGGTPRQITSGRRVPAGTSGAVSLAGLVAAVAGAAFIAGSALLLGWPGRLTIAVFVGGMAGALADTLVGAVVQARRRCPACESLTERAVHSCGSATVHAGGVRWMNNDAVNVVAASVGALIAILGS
ncbi:MAG TPA: DUF92 domain-containing protein [Gemmatimonadaceae bacterium]|nr:DUF92 domain-containing protein [Gemmatimonadaceae bacterium]